jgi:hypothetical protein
MAAVIHDRIFVSRGASSISAFRGDAFHGGIDLNPEIRSV